MASGDKIEQLRLIDYETGEIQLDLTRVKKKDQLGKDWVAMYQKGMKSIIEEVPTLGTMKILLFLIANLDYDVKFTGSKAYIARQVKLSYQEAHKCLKWLEENHYIQMEKNEMDSFDFYVNPDVAMRGNKKTRAVNGWASRSGIEVRRKKNKVVFDLTNLKP